MSASPPIAVKHWRRSETPLCANTGCEQSQQRSLYSITSSASSCIELGTARPKAFAVLKLMTNSNLVDRCTGTSAGFSPLTIRPVYTPAWRYEIRKVASITHKPTSDSKFTRRIDCRNRMPGRQRNDVIALRNEEGIGGDK
jgi:hypothetical protein